LAGTSARVGWRFSIVAALMLCALTLAPAGAARANTVVSLTFDDGIATQNQIRALLAAHGMRGTFYLNSGHVGTGPYYMTWANVDALNADGNEIAGHTVDHQRLSTLTASQQRHEICDDAAALRARGYAVIDFAYPFGDGASISSVRSALLDCGYVSARNFGDLYSQGCTYETCPYAESIPPSDLYAIRTPEFQSDEYDLSELKAFVTEAETHGGGWVPIVFHDICNECAASSVSLSTFNSFLNWLQTSGAVVKTVRSVFGYPDLPPPAQEPPLPVRAFASSAPDKVTAFASLKARKRQDVDSVYVSAAMLEPGALTATGTVGVPSASRVFKFKRTVATATPGKRVKLRLRLSKNGLRAAKRAIRAHKRLRAKITITATDRAGNRKTAKRTVRLRD
jgi:peptidoglycan/xylan/chitin deacetylase (PgdA/CDA1 family)